MRACVCIHDMHALCKKKINVYMNMKEAVMEKNGLAADIVIYWSALFLTHTHLRSLTGKERGVEERAKVCSRQ